MGTVIGNEELLGTFALRLRGLCAYLEVTQQEVAARTGLSRAFVGHLMTGVRKPTIVQLKLVANALGTSIDYLCGNTDLADAPLTRGQKEALIGTGGLEVIYLSQSVYEAANRIDSQEPIARAKALAVLDILLGEQATVSDGQPDIALHAGAELILGRQAAQSLAKRIRERRIPHDVALRPAAAQVP